MYPTTSGNLKGLPQGVVHANSDLELKPLWSTSSSRSKLVSSGPHLRMMLRSGHAFTSKCLHFVLGRVNDICHVFSSIMDEQLRILKVIVVQGKKLVIRDSRAVTLMLLSSWGIRQQRPGSFIVA
ncbi:hypothetical protein HKD37_09G025428 [Glycine soja]|uniref:Uncharacterized protein n=1 Tax=Glycine soja TaxID=3848 RepID=A0A445J078_GLYSO|nr:hypothetical protein D0Y65_023975 [Glycine soja]RZB91793.1 hypothetical protein D0Y65_023975 [Glycine soja]